MLDVCQLQDVLEAWPRPYWEDPAVVSYLQHHCPNLNPLSEPPPLAILERWTRGDALSLLHIHQGGVQLPQLRDPQWGESLSSMGLQVYNEGDCRVSIVEWEFANLDHVCGFYQWLESHSRTHTAHSSSGVLLTHGAQSTSTFPELLTWFEVQAPTEVDCVFEHVTVWPGWPAIAALECTFESHMMSVEVHDLRELGGQCFLPWLELIFQLAQTLQREPQLGADWDFTSEVLCFENLYQRYALLRSSEPESDTTS